ncbi:MAG: twitching motility protein PilT [Thermoplasmata archaeon]|nr:MAG: twitching motility protein PilT [Thermoplasmata archaeon]
MAADRIRNNKVILDTNALLMPFQFKLNLDSELTRLLGQYEIIIPSSVIAELENLYREKQKPRWIKSALSLAKKYQIEHVNGSGDDAICKAAQESNAIVVTNDKALKKRLKSRGVRTIWLKSKTHLVLDE